MNVFQTVARAVDQRREPLDVALGSRYVQGPGGVAEVVLRIDDDEMGLREVEFLSIS